MSRYQRLRAKNGGRHSSGVALADEGDCGGAAAAHAAQLAVHAPHLMREQDVASLQATAGNRAVQRALENRQPVVQRELTWTDTDWNRTKFLDASTSGGGGVLFAGEVGREVVIKPGEELPGEGAVAAYMISQAAGAGGTGFGLAPGYRIPSNRERAQIKNALKPLVGKPGQKQRVSDLVAKLDDPGLVIQDMGQGKQLGDVIGDVKKHTKKKLFGGGARKFRKESPLRIFTDARAIHAMGSVTSVDLFMGNKDRLFQFNPDNFLVSPYSISMIDNVWTGSEKGYFHTATVATGSGSTMKITADDALSAWIADPEVKQLAASDYKNLADTAFDRVHDAMLRRTSRVLDDMAIQRILRSTKGRFVDAFADGLRVGKDQVIASLTKLAGSYKAMHNMVGGVHVAEIRRSIQRRLAFLRGTKSP